MIHRQTLPNKECAFRLLLEGSEALAKIESNGMRIDLGYCNKQMERLTDRVNRIESKIQSSDLWVHWEKKYGATANINSGNQFGDILFNVMGFEPKSFTQSGRPEMTESALEQIDDPVVDLFLKRKKFLKARDTYFKNFVAETTDGYMHPIFNLHTVRTYRSSSDSPNFQNIPVRNKRIARLIRRAFLARPGHRIVETDFSGLEVAIAACYHKDPNMIAYLNDKTKDLHRDVAALCYKLRASEVTEPIRHCGKNMFVFPQFYGSIYWQCAPSLWEAVESMDLETADGVSLRKHLTDVGFRRLGRCEHGSRPAPGTFGSHIQSVENVFWRQRFRVYAQWKRDWYNQYIRKGYLDSLTGFRMSGLMARNDVINYPVQGAAFHALLWSLIEIQKEIELRGMRSLIIGQIHDSIVSDVHAEEFGEYLEIVDEVMSQRLPAAWDWIIVPLDVETEASPVDGNWWQKKKIDG